MTPAITFTVRTTRSDPDSFYAPVLYAPVRADLYVGDHRIDSAWGDDEAEAITRVEQRLARGLRRLIVAENPR